MTIPGIARRLVEAYGRDAARDKAILRSHDNTAWSQSRRYSFWRSVARACTRVPVPARRGATP